MPQEPTQPPEKRKITIKTVAKILAGVAAFSALLIGVVLGIALASTCNEINQENFEDFRPNLPTRLLDIKGRQITEFSSYEKREMVSISEVPRCLIQALITREDQDFYKHHGFSVSGIFRAFVGVVIHRNLGGGSTITQQLAGALKTDRNERTIKRKIVELWWAMQFERRFTKDEILELYMNKVYFGDGYYGVESASKYYFGHSVKEITLAESAVLVLQLSSTTGMYSPFKHPENAKERSWYVLKQMAKLGYCTLADAKKSYDEYWGGFDYTRVATSAYFNREDKARYFSEYVRRQLDDMLYGSIDYNEDGLTVYTTLDLDYQAFADARMAKGIADANAQFKRDNSSRLGVADATYVPLVNGLSLMFDLTGLRSAESRAKSRLSSAYQTKVNPVVDASALLFGISGLKPLTNKGYDAMRAATEKTTVEGALITIDNDTGYVKALVGGSGYSQTNQSIRAIQARVQPGSCFKPLYYSAAIDTRKFTEASLIYDEPIIFHDASGKEYRPLNYKNEWFGPVLMWKALAKSLNVPSLRVLDGIGFDAAINRAASLLDITDPVQIAQTFPRVYPLGLGVISVSPLQMARAFAVFANQGRRVDPISIRQVIDRDGQVIVDVEKELRAKQKRMGQDMQVITPQTAYIMTDMLQRVTRVGTLSYSAQAGYLLSYADASGKKYTIPCAGKTGTTQNWADAWTVGFSPYMTTAIWFGFDSPGNSLGTTQTGAAIAGSAWGDYMYQIHRGLSARGFVKPQTGLVEANVCSISGQLPGPNCNEGTDHLVFLEGTQPQEICSYHNVAGAQQSAGLSVIQDSGAAPAASGGSLLQIDSSLGSSPAPASGGAGGSGGLDFGTDGILN